jgi:hypothetical protein
LVGKENVVIVAHDEAVIARVNRDDGSLAAIDRSFDLGQEVGMHDRAKV